MSFSATDVSSSPERNALEGQPDMDLPQRSAWSVTRGSRVNRKKLRHGVATLSSTRVARVHEA